MAEPAPAPDREVADEPAAVPTRRRLPVSRFWLASAYVVVVVILAVLGLLQVLSVRHHDNLDSRRRAAVDAASGEVVSLLSVSQASASADIKRLLAGATAGFHDQLEQEAKSFVQALTQGKVTSTGTVAAAGLVSFGAKSATVAIAATATVKNSASPKGEARNYRLTVTVESVHNHWLVAGLKFVV